MDQQEPSSSPIAPISPTTASINVANFVPTKLQWLPNGIGTNYETWKEQMLCLMKSQGLIKYIDGTMSLPLREKEDYNIWENNNAFVKGWILGSTSEKIASTVLELHSAKDIWLRLEAKFDRPETNISGENADRDHKIPFILALISSDWKGMKQILDDDTAAGDIVNSMKQILDDDTAAGDSVDLQQLLDKFKGGGRISSMLEEIPDQYLVDLKSHRGSSVLHIAAAVGNKDAVQFLVHRVPDLCNKADDDGDFPIQYAARYAQMSLLKYMISVTENVKDPDPFAHLPGLRILTFAIDAEFFDIAINLVKKYPHLTVLRSEDNDPALFKIVGSSVLANRRQFNFWERSIASVCQNRSILGKLVQRVVPGTSSIIKRARANDEARNLVNLICDKLKANNSWEAQTIIQNAILKTRELGVQDVAQMLVDKFPLSNYAYEVPSWQFIFRKAVENRSEGVFNLIYEMKDHKHIFYNNKDRHGNNLLHLAAKLAPAHKLNMIPGAALQMQRELQWFKEVQNLVPYATEEINFAEKTPQQMFTDEHKNLKEVGEKWMKDTANSCTISAALIATVMFAAAITVPGGNHEDTGYPMFSYNAAFIIFAVSDAISLFSSATSLLLFLAILTSRYAEEDFLSMLPKRLIFGLATLFLSITFMMISFSVTLYLIFGQKKAWVLAPVLVFASLPVTSFALLQFPLLIDLISCTYFPSIFSKKRNRQLY